LESLSEAGAESTIIDGASNLKQQISTASWPPHLLTSVHPPVYRKIGRSFGDRGANAQSGTMALGVIDQASPFFNANLRQIVLENMDWSRSGL
jgi:hypothetical protein